MTCFSYAVQYFVYFQYFLFVRLTLSTRYIITHHHGEYLFYSNNVRTALYIS